MNDNDDTFRKLFGLVSRVEAPKRRAVDDRLQEKYGAIDVTSKEDTTSSKEKSKLAYRLRLKKEKKKTNIVTHIYEQTNKGVKFLFPAKDKPEIIEQLGKLLESIIFEEDVSPNKRRRYSLKRSITQLNTPLKT